MDITPFPIPLERIEYHNAGVMGLRADLAALPSRDLLDQYAVIVMLPEPLRSQAAVRLTLIRDILLERLAGAA